mmetsp:Transcript_14622/g.57389  ORF Transcript_14622/g.57389 Transcript_14622/m.57389 type:complete len:255 (+) Transcript_14622:274-1038(+)
MSVAAVGQPETAVSRGLRDVHVLNCECERNVHRNGVGRRAVKVRRNGSDLGVTKAHLEGTGQPLASEWVSVRLVRDSSGVVAHDVKAAAWRRATDVVDSQGVTTGIQGRRRAPGYCGAAGRAAGSEVGDEHVRRAGLRPRNGAADNVHVEVAGAALAERIGGSVSDRGGANGEVLSRSVGLRPGNAVAVVRRRCAKRGSGSGRAGACLRNVCRAVDVLRGSGVLDRHRVSARLRGRVSVNVQAPVSSAGAQRER